MADTDWSKGKITNPAGEAIATDWNAGTITPPVKPAGFVRKAADLGLGFASGALGATKSVSDAAGAGNAVSSALDTADKFVQSGLSDQAVADQQRQQAILKESQGKDIYEGLKSAGKAFAVAPVQTAVTGLGSVVPTIAAGLATGGASVPVSLGAMAAMGVAQGAGSIKGGIYDDIKQRSAEARMDPVAAEAAALKAQEYGGPNTRQIALGAALGMGDSVTGVSKIATSMLRKGVGKGVGKGAQELAEGSARGFVARAALGAAGEVPLEAAQGGQQQYASNVASQREGFAVNPWDNVVSQGAFEGLASAGPGTAFGALHGRAARPTPIKPSEAMGLNPTAGPISAAAVLAVDGGAHDAAISEQNQAQAQAGQGKNATENVAATPLASATSAATRADEQVPGALMPATQPETAGLAELANQNGVDIGQPFSGTPATARVGLSATQGYPASGSLAGSGISPSESTQPQSQSGQPFVQSLQGGQLPDGTSPTAVGTGQFSDGTGPDQATQRQGRGSNLGSSPNDTAPAPTPQERLAKLNSEIASGTNADTGAKLTPFQMGVRKAQANQIVSQLPKDASAGVQPSNDATSQAPQAQAAIESVASSVKVNPTSSNPVPASWVIKEKATGNVVMETFDQKKVDALNTGKYEAVPILQHLQGLNTPATEPAQPQGVTRESKTNQALPQQTQPEPSAAPVAGTASEVAPAPARDYGDRLPPEKAMQLQEANRALGRDVTRQQVQGMRDRVAGEIASGQTNNGGVMASLKPAAIAQRKEQLSRLDQDLALFDGAPAAQNAATPKLNPIQAAAVAKQKGIDTTSMKPAQVVAAIAQADAAPAGPAHLGRNNQPLSEGGKPYKTRLAAADAKKLQPMMRVVAVKDGFVLAEKTEKQVAAEAKAARRLRNPQTSAPGEPIPAHAFIAAEGGLHKDTRPDMNIGANPKIGNRTLFAGKGKGISMERATARLIEEGYLSEGASHNEAAALIKRSLTKPQYNADGIERIAIAEEEARYAAYDLEMENGIVEAEALDDNEFDALDNDIPWDEAGQPSSYADFLSATGATEQEIQNEIASESGISQASSESSSRPIEAAASDAQAGDEQRAPAQGQDEGLNAPPPEFSSFEAKTALLKTSPLLVSADGTLNEQGKALARTPWGSMDAQDRALVQKLSQDKKSSSDTYNDKIRVQEREIERRQMQENGVIQQANGKPFKTEASAKARLDEFDLSDTHKIAPALGGFVLRQMPPAEQAEVKRKAEGRESYTEAQDAVLREMGIDATSEDGEIDATEAQWAEIDRRTNARLRGAPETLTTPGQQASTPAELAQASADLAELETEYKTARGQRRSDVGQQIDRMRSAIAERKTPAPVRPKSVPEQARATKAAQALDGIDVVNQGEGRYVELQGASEATYKKYGATLKIGNITTGNAWLIGIDDYLKNSHVLKKYAVTTEANIRMNRVRAALYSVIDAAGADANQNTPVALTAPSKQDILSQQARTEQATQLDEKAQIDREAGKQTLTRQAAPEQRTDTSGDMFAMEKATAEIDKRNAGRAAKDDPNQGGMFSRPTKPEPKVENLVTLHNLTAENLLHAAGMGGIAVPSIGITKVESPFGGFGDITLIAPKGMIDPASGTPVFDRDAYTARHPAMNFKKVKAGKADAFYERMNVGQQFGERGTGFLSQLWETIKNASTQSPDKVADLFMQYNEPKMMYAKEVLGKDIKVPMREVRLQSPVASDKAVMAYFKEHEAAVRGRDEVPAADAAKARAEFAAIVGAAIDRYAATKPNPTAIAKIFHDSMMDEDGLTYRAARDLSDDIPRVGTKEVDRVKLGEAVSKVVPLNDPAYKKWVESLVKPLFEAPTITLRGKEVEPTLSNVVEAMTIGGVAGSEKTMTSSPGKVAAQLGKRFKSLAEIQAARDQIVSEADEEVGKKSTDALLTKYRERVLGFYTEKDWRGQIDTWNGMDAAMDALALAGKNSLTDGNINIALQRKGFKGTDKEALNLAREVIAALRNSATNYFEAKPQRAVRLNEFSGAVVPKGTSQEVLDILAANGIEVLAYSKTLDGAKNKAVEKLARALHKKQGDVLFARSAKPATDQPTTNTAKTVRAALAKRFGLAITQMEKRGFLKIWDTTAQFNESGQSSIQIEGAAQGLWTGKTAHLFADGIAPGNEVAVMLHEVGEHASMKQMLGDKAYARLVARAYELALDGNPLAQAALERIPNDTNPRHFDSELLAYMIEIVAAQDAKATPGARKWLADVVAAIRAWWSQTGAALKLRDYGIRMELTPKDISALAVRAVKWQGRQGRESEPVGVPAFSRGTNEPVTNLKDVVGNSQGGRSADDLTPGAAKQAAFAAKTIPLPEIPKKLSQEQFQDILQDIHSFGPSAKDDAYSRGELFSVFKKLKSAGIDFIDMYHVTDANLSDFEADGVKGFAVDHAGNAGGQVRSASVYGFLDPDDIANGYDGILGAKSDTPNVIHIKLPVGNLLNLRWDSNFNASFGTYSGIRFVGNVKNEWIAGAYRYDISKKSVLSSEFPNESIAPDSGGAPMFSRASAIGDTLKDALNRTKETTVGSTGRYTAAQLQAMRNIGATVTEPSLKERAEAIWKDLGKKMAQGIADQFAPIKELDEKAYNLLRLSKGASGAFESLLRGGKLKLTDNAYDFDESQRGGVIDKLLTPLQGEHHDALRWVAANRAERLMNESEATRAEGVKLLAEAVQLDADARALDNQAKQYLQQAGNFPKSMTGNQQAQKANAVEANKLMAQAERTRKEATEKRKEGNEKKNVSRENLFTKEDIAAFKTLTDGTTGFDYTIQNGIQKGQVTRNRALIYKDFNTNLNGFNANVLDMATQSGLIDPESRKLWESEFYVPFYRVADESDGGVRGMNIGSVVRQQPFKTLKGGKQALQADLLDNVLMNWAHLLDASAKNRAAKASLEAAEKMGVAVSAPEATVRNMAGTIGKKNNVVWFMDEGKPRHFLIDDPYVMTALTALEYAGMRNPAMNAMSAFKHALTVGVTASPFFKVRNLIRDSVQVIAAGPIGYNPATNIKQGWALTDPKSDAYFRLLAGGGTIHFGTMMEGNEAKRVQALVESGVKDFTILDGDHKVKAFYRKFIEPGVTAYNELGNRGEAINRAALYDQLIKQGIGHAEASLQARDLMDFSMQGSFTSVRFLTQVVPFMNAKIQGLYKLGRAANEDPKRFAAVLGAAAMFSLLLLAAYSDDDDWKQREDWDKNSYWWFKFGGEAFRIPKPFEIGAIATLAERGAELFFDKEMTGQRFATQVKALLGDNLSMNPIPQMVKPMIDVYANKDSFSGRPIETMGMEKLKPEYRFNGRTSMTARGVSTAINTVAEVVGSSGPSPVQIDHLLRGYFGWLGSFVVGTADVIARPMTNQPGQAAPDYWKTATGGIASSLEGAPSRYVSQIYQQAKEIEQAYGTWRDLQRQGKAGEAADFYQENRDALAKYRNVEHVKKSESKLNEQIRRIERSDIPADDKRTQITRIRNQQNLLAKLVA